MSRCSVPHELRHVCRGPGGGLDIAVMPQREITRFFKRSDASSDAKNAINPCIKTAFPKNLHKFPWNFDENYLMTLTSSNRKSP